MIGEMVALLCGVVGGWLAGGRWHTIAAGHWLLVERWLRRLAGR